MADMSKRLRKADIGLWIALAGQAIVLVCILIRLASRG